MSGSGNDSGLLLKIAFFLLAVALLFHLIGIAAPNWAYNKVDDSERSEHIGLWKYCTYPYGGGESCNDFVNIIYGDWLKAAQSFMVLALFVLPAAVGLVALCAFMPDYADDMRVLSAAMGATALAGLFTLVSVCSFGGRYQEYFDNKEIIWKEDGHIGSLGWAFSLTVVDMIICFISLGLTIACI